MIFRDAIGALIVRNWPDFMGILTWGRKYPRNLRSGSWTPCVRLLA